MKLLIILLFSLITTTIEACPNLNGSYRCGKAAHDPNNLDILTISFVDGYYNFVYKEDPANPSSMPTDGKIHKKLDGSTYKGSCTPLSFTSTFSGISDKVGKYKINITFTLDSNKNLVQKGFINTTSDRFPIDLVCARI